MDEDIYERGCYTPPPVLRRQRSIADTRHLSASVDSLISPRRRQSPAMARKLFGSVEELATVDARSGSSQTKRFRIESQSVENGLEQLDSIASKTTAAAYLENPEIETRWYFKYFLGKVHQNFVGCDAKGNPFFLSVVATDADNHGGVQYRSILWQKKGNTRLCFPYTPGKSVNYKTVLQQFNMTKFDKSPREISSPAIQKDLLTLEEQEGTVNFKFGVLYCKEGQTQETDMFSNVSSSENYKNFLKLLGDKIPLENWDRYRGGLDRSGRTGSHSVFTVYKGHDIMFHVSTMLPYSTDNPQQLERKRHIGNDICVIVFCDGKQPSFQPSQLKSQFVHIFAVVTFDEGEDAYGLQVYSSEAVPVFGPHLPTKKAFKDHLAFREFLLAKLMNGEKAAYMTPVFKEKRERTLDVLIKGLEKEYEAIMVPRHSGFISDGLPVLSPRVQRRKNQAKVTEFQQIGQDLKLKRIVKGDAPTSLQTSTSIKRDPWEPEPLFDEPFQHAVYCGDTWGEDVVIGSSGGVFLFHDKEYHCIIPKVMVMQQMSVLEQLGIAFMRGSSSTSKDKYLFAIPLTQLHAFGSGALSKDDCKKFRVGKTKGCHLFAVSPLDSKTFYVAIAVKTKVIIYKWVYTVDERPSSEMEGHIESALTFVKEISFGESVHVMRLIDGSVTGRNDLLCVGYRRQFELVDLGTYEREKVLDLGKKSRETLVSVLDVYEDNHAEIVVTHGHMSLNKSLSSTDDVPDVEIRWNSAPNSVAFVFPYILGFSSNTIEIRLAINGSLVHTLKMPHVQLIADKNDLIFVSTASIRRTPSMSDMSTAGQSKPKAPRMRMVSSSGTLQASVTTTNYVYRISADALAGVTPSSSPSSTSPVHLTPPGSEMSTLIVGAPKLEISRTKSLKRFRLASHSRNPHMYSSLRDLELAFTDPGSPSYSSNVDMSPLSPSLLDRGLPSVSLTSV